MRGKGSKLGKPCPKVRLSQDRGKGTMLGEGEGSKLGEPCPKVRLSQDRMPIEPFGHMES